MTALMPAHGGHRARPDDATGPLVVAPPATDDGAYADDAAHDDSGYAEDAAYADEGPRSDAAGYGDAAGYADDSGYADDAAHDDAGYADDSRYADSGYADSGYADAAGHGDAAGYADVGAHPDVPGRADARAAGGQGPAAGGALAAGTAARPVPSRPGSPRPGPARSRPARPTRPAVLVVGGVVWAVLLLVGVALGPAAVAVVVAPVVVVAVLSGQRAAGRSGGAGAPVGPRLAALLVAGVAPLVAVAGPIPFVVVAGAAVAVLAWLPDGAPRTARVLLAVAAPVLGGGCLVLAARQGTELVTVLVIAICLFDLANSVMGTGETGGPIGAIAGAATVVVLAVIVDSLLDPPFVGHSSWVLCALVAVAAPVGVTLCRRLAPGRLPALRRLDSLCVAAPIWVVAVAVLLHP